MPAATAPVLVGTAVAYHAHKFQPLPALACLVGALLLQIGSNLANDYFDFKKGADTPFRLGPTRVTQAGLISPRAVLNGMILVFALAVGVGFYLLSVGGLAVGYIGVASIVAAILYTGGPFPYGYKGLGELFVFLFFGPVAVIGTEYVQTGTTSTLGILASVPSGLLCANVLIVNNLRDREQDKVAKKMTLIARYGRKFGLDFYVANLGIAFLIAEALIFVTKSAWGLLPLLLLPIAWKLNKKVAATEGRALNPLLGETARFQLIFCAVQALAIALAIAI